MQSIEYTISISNANDAINRIHQGLKDRNVKHKHSDLKELVAQLLSLGTSNALDARIKAHKETCDALAIFDKKGALKDNPKVVHKRFKSGIEAHKFFHKYQGYESVFFFEESFTSEAGFSYEVGDFLFAVDSMDAAQVLLNWDQNAKLKYVLNNKAEREHFDRGGRWQFELSSNDLLNSLAMTSIIFDFYEHECDAPDSNTVKLEREAFDEMSLMELPFSDIHRFGCKDIIKDWLLEDFRAAYTKVIDLDSFKEMVKRFLPYFPIQEIAEMAAFSVPVEYLASLQDFGAKLNEHTVLLSAAAGGQLDCCEYLLSQGNSLDAFYRVDLNESKSCAMHDEFTLLIITNKADEIIPYLATLKALYVDINYNQCGETFLYMIASIGDEKLYLKAIEIGCDKNAYCEDGLTPADELRMANVKDRLPLFDDDENDRICL